MTPLEAEIARQRATLMRIEQKGASDIASTYQRVEKRLEANLKLLTEEIEAARAAGVEVRPGWLFAQQRYRQLTGELREETLAFLQRAIATITNGQAKAVELGPKDANGLTLKALGPAPRSAISEIQSRFGRLPARALEYLVGRAGDGQPLGDLLSEITPASAQSIKDSLAFGVATGKSPRVIASDVMARSQMTKTRALAISRTEIVGSYRAASTEQYKASKIVKTWTWITSLDSRVCPSCAAMDGTEHPIDEELHSHPCCRCGKSPNTPSWAELGFSGIPDNRPARPRPGQRFNALSEADKLAILGQARLSAYNRGEITLQDLVHHTESKRWGPGRRAATLTELGLRV